MDISCHSERREVCEVCEWCIGNDFRFFTTLRYVQNDRMNVGYVHNDRMNVSRVQKDRMSVSCVQKDRVYRALRSE